MKTKKWKKARKVAEELNEQLAFPRELWCNYYVDRLFVTNFFAIDDDPKSVIYASKLMKTNDNPDARLECVGGKGRLSFLTHETTEGQHLADIAIENCGVPKNLVGVHDKGANTGANIRDIKNAIAEQEGHDPDDPCTGIYVFVLTKRLSERFERSLALQAPNVWERSEFYVIDENFEDSCTIHNGKALGDMRMMFHEIASIYVLCERYSKEGTKEHFMLTPHYEKTDELVKKAMWLAKHYPLKLTRTIPDKLKALPQYIAMFFRIINSLPKRETDLDRDIQRILGPK